MQQVDQVSLFAFTWIFAQFNKMGLTDYKENESELQFTLFETINVRIQCIFRKNVFLLEGNLKLIINLNLIPKGKEKMPLKVDLVIYYFNANNI